MTMVVDGRVLALSADLMDRSKISAAFPQAEIVRLVAERSLDDVALLLVDLNIDGAIDVIDLAVAHGIRVVAYGSHVDSLGIIDAGTAGADAMPRSVFFRRIGAGTLLDATHDD